MNRKILSLCIAGMAAFGAFAETGTVDFTYAQTDFTTYGKGKKEMVDVAICIDDPALQGMKLTALKAYISTTEGISETSLWGSSNLTVEKNLNVPDLFSYDVTPGTEIVGEYNFGVLEVELDEPYVLTDKPLYVGYTISVDENTTDEQKKPIVIAGGTNPNGFFLHMQKSVLKWLDYSSKANGVAYIVASIEGDFPGYSLGFKSYKPIYANDSENFQALFNVSNIGVNTVENLKYTYSVDGGETIEGTLNLLDPITPSLSLTVPVSLSFNSVTGLGPHSMTVEITEVNGQPNEAGNSVLDCLVNVIPFTPVKRPLVEEYTGLWCGYCPRGFLAMEMIAENYGNDEVSVCYHNGDPMAVTDSYPMNIDGFPSSTIDRKSIIDPYYGSYDTEEFGISLNLEEAMDEIAIAQVHVSSSLEGEEVNVESQVTFIQDIANANYEVGYVLIANGLTDPSWGQHNYYAGATSDYAGTPLEVLTTWDAIQYGLVFNDVAIDTSADKGVEGSLPASIVTNETYTGSYSFDISDNSLVQDVNNLVIAAYVIDKNTGRIVNANKCAINSSGVKAIETTKVAVSSEYFDLTGRKVINPANGLFIKVDKYSDGSRKASKILLSK